MRLGFQKFYGIFFLETGAGGRDLEPAVKKKRESKLKLRFPEFQ